MIYELCWVCEEAPGTSCDCRNKGACGRCYARLKKRYGSANWQAEARQAIAQGNRESLQAFAPCPTCEDGRMSPATSKHGVCNRCARRGRHLSPEERKAKNLKRNELKRRAAERLQQERQERFETERRRGLKLDRERVLARQEARIRTQRIKALTLPDRNAWDDPKSYALREAQKNPTLHVIPVHDGKGIAGRTRYFEPYLDGEGVLQVREMRGV